MLTRGFIVNFFIVAGLALVVAGAFAKSGGTVGGSTAGTILMLLGAIWALVGLGVRALYAAMRKRARAEQELFESGTKAVAVVEGVETTGTVFNEINVQIILRLRVRPRSEPEFAYQRKMYVPFNGVPRTGDVLDVAYHPDDKSKVALATDWRSNTGGGRLLLLRRPEESSTTHVGWQSNGALDAAPAAGGDESGPRTGSDRIIELLERLHRLKQDGVLTEAEFEQQKAKILSEPAT